MAYMNRTRGTWTPATYTTAEREEIAQYEREQAAEETARYEQNNHRRAAMHPAYRGAAAALETENDEYPTVEDVAVFVLDTIAKIGRATSDETLKQELRTIYRDVRDNGADAYGANKARLQHIVAIVNGGRHA